MKGIFLVMILGLAMLACSACHAIAAPPDAGVAIASAGMLDTKQNATVSERTKVPEVATCTDTAGADATSDYLTMTYGNLNYANLNIGLSAGPAASEVVAGVAKRRAPNETA